MTLGQALRTTVSRFGDRPAFVTVGKDAVSLNYREVYARVGQYATALKGLGLLRGDRVVILSENSMEWALFDWACHCLGLVVVPIYPTLPADQAVHILLDAGAKVAICSDSTQAAKLDSAGGLRILLLKGGPETLDGLAGSSSVLQTLDAEIDAAKPEDPCTIIYTSGTTGVPKGAVMPHRAFLHVAHSAKDHIFLSEEDSFFSFLPMSHVYERVAGQVLPVTLGAKIGFSKGLAYLGKELGEFKPTVLLCVPRFLENMRERILSGSEKMPPLRKKLFDLTLSQGIQKARGQFAPLAGILDKIVGAKVRDHVGGRLRYFVSGGAALAPNVAEFYMAMGFVVLQGYGLTETAGGSVVNRPENNKYWTVGEPLAMELKIAEDGEILMRGPGIMLGYYNMPEETAAAIDPEGWFHTGDIGEFEGKNLKITDRKKDILVLANGKNVAPQAVENRLKASDYISEAVVFGNAMDHCIGLIIPNEEAVRKATGLPEGEAMSGSEAVRQLIKREIDRINKTQASFEMVRKFAILDKPFSVDSGELTPSLKVKRKVVAEKFAATLQELAS